MKKQSFRIPSSAIGILHADFMPVADNGTKKLISAINSTRKPQDDFNCLSLLLYTNLINSGIIESDVSRLKPTLVGDIDAIKAQLKSKNKYAQFTDEQLTQKINEIVLKDTRNCLAHGVFEVLPNKNVAKSQFEFKNPRSEITVDHHITLNFDIVHDEIGVELKNVNFLGKTLSSYSPEEAKTALLNQASKDENLIMQLVRTHMNNLIIPSTIERMIDYYFLKLQGMHTYPPKFNDQQFLTIMFIIKSAMLTYEQNDYHTLLGPQFDEVLNTIGLIRNSFIHGHNKIDGVAVELEDQYRNNIRIERTDLMKIGILIDNISQYKLQMQGSTSQNANSTKNENIFPNDLLNTPFEELLNLLTNIVKSQNANIEELLNL